MSNYNQNQGGNYQNFQNYQNNQNYQEAQYPSNLPQNNGNMNPNEPLLNNQNQPGNNPQNYQNNPLQTPNMYQKPDISGTQPIANPPTQPVTELVTVPVAPPVDQPAGQPVYQTIPPPTNPNVVMVNPSPVYVAQRRRNVCCIVGIVLFSLFFVGVLTFILIIVFTRL